MALNDKVLNDFFGDKPKQEIKKSSEKNKSKKYSRFRIFDNPNEIKGTNRTQTGDKPNTNRTQTGDKPNTNRTQIKQRDGNFELLKTQTEHKLNTQLNTVSNTNLTQTEHKLNTNHSVSTLIGLQRKILFFIYNSCKKIRSNTSEPLSVEYISSFINIVESSVKTTLSRLIEKKILVRSTFKNGRGGWSSYEIPETIFKELILLETEQKLNTNRTQTEHKLNTELNTELNTTPLSSSSINYKTTTTNNLAITQIWDLNITPLAHIGFTEKHLEQISKRTQCSQEDVQEAIYAFAHDLENNKLKIRNGNEPLNFFMGIMGKGSLYLPASSDYVNPEVKAVQLYLNKRKEHKVHCKELDNELRIENFEQWNSGLSEEEKEKILPEEVRKSPIKPYVHSILLAYHKKTIWPEIRLSFYKERDIPFFELEFESGD